MSQTMSNVTKIPAQDDDADLERLKREAISVDAAAYLKSIRNNFKYPSWYCGHRYGANIKHCPKCGPGFELSVRKGESTFSCTKFNRIDGKYDFQHGPKGNVVEMVMHIDGCSEQEACEKLADFAAANGGGTVTKLPERPIRVPAVHPEMVDSIYRRGEWRDIATWLSDENIKTWYKSNLYSFVHDMRVSKKRPTTAQMGFLFGLALNVQLQMAIDDIERPEREAEEEMRKAVETEVRQRMAEKRAAKAGGTNVVPMVPQS